VLAVVKAQDGGEVRVVYGAQGAVLGAEGLGGDAVVGVGGDTHNGLGGAFDAAIGALGEPQSHPGL
jgi:hypothetical protein